MFRPLKKLPCVLLKLIAFDLSPTSHAALFIPKLTALQPVHVPSHFEQYHIAN